MGKNISYLWFDGKGFKAEYTELLCDLVERIVRALDSGVDILTVKIHLKEYGLQSLKKGKDS